MSRVLVACRNSPQTSWPWVENGTPISIQAVFDGLTEAFANVAPYKGTSRGFAESALAMNMLSTGYQKVPVSARSRFENFHLYW